MFGVSGKGLLSGIATAVGLALASGPASAVLIDFETTGLAEGDAIGSIGIATFSNVQLVERGGPVAAFWAHSAKDNAGAGAGTFMATVITPPTGVGTVTFSAPVASLALDVIDIEHVASTGEDESFTATVFDALTGGTALASITVTPSTPGAGDGKLVPVDFSGTGGIRRLEFSESLDSGSIPGYAIDNLSFVSTAVPEPGLLSLLGLGLLGLALGRTRAA